MVKVTGKTINQLEQIDSLDDNFMFLGCYGTNTAYSTWKTTYGTLKEDLSAQFMNSLGSNIETRLDEIEKRIDTGDGSLYLKKANNNEQFVTSEVRFKNKLNIDDSIRFQCGTNRQSSDTYRVILPKDTFRNPTNNSGTDFAYNDNTRVAINQDILNAINNFRQETQHRSEQIMDTSYAPYLTNGVAVQPFYKNKNYIYDSTSGEPNVFYRYAGIKSKQEYTGNGSLDRARNDGIVYKQLANKYTGIPLTKSYNQFQTLTIYTSTALDIDSANEAERIYSINIDVHNLNIARQYKDYKAQYKHKTNYTSYFDNVADKWYLGDAYDGEVFLNLKCSATFTDTFIPLMLKNNSMILIGVFGHT